MYLTAVTVICVYGIGLATATCVDDNKDSLLAALSSMDPLSTIYNNNASNSPTVLTTYCNSDEPYLAKAKTMQTTLAACSDLLNDAAVVTAMGSQKIAKLSFTDMFKAFSSVDGFCVCAPMLPAAWGLAAYIETENVPLSTKVDQAAYEDVANVALFCGNPMVKEYMQALYEGTRTSCPQLSGQTKMGKTPADQLKFKKRMAIAAMCGADFNETNWTCALDEIKTPVFKKCIHDANSLTSDKAQCSSRSCVHDNIGASDKCGAGIADLFIAAVNYEDKNLKKIKHMDCDSATSIQLSMMAIVVVILAKIF